MYYVIALCGWAYVGWFLLNIWRNIWHILNKFGTQKHQDKTKIKFELDDIDLIFYFRSQRSFKVATCGRWFPLNIWRNIWCILTEFGTQKHQGMVKTMFEPGDFDLIFRGHWGHLERQHMKDGFLSITEEIFDVSSPNLVHTSTRARQRPSSNRVTLLIFEVTEVI